MKDILLVRVLDGAGDGGDEAGRVARRQRAVLRESLGERLALDVLHAEVGLPPGRADLVDGDDVRVLEPRRRFGLGPEAGAVCVGGQVRLADHLERDGAVERFLSGLVDDAHAAAPEFGEQFEVPELARQRHRERVPGRSRVERQRGGGGRGAGHVGELRDGPQFAEFVGEVRVGGRRRRDVGRAAGARLFAQPGEQGREAGVGGIDLT